jgi:hypothetical protein
VPLIRKFLEEALEELGFTACECTQVGKPSAVLDGQAPTPVIAGFFPSCLDFCTI